MPAKPPTEPKAKAPKTPAKKKRAPRKTVPLSTHEELRAKFASLQEEVLALREAHAPAAPAPSTPDFPSGLRAHYDNVVAAATTVCNVRNERLPPHTTNAIHVLRNKLVKLRSVKDLLGK